MSRAEGAVGAATTTRRTISFDGTSIAFDLYPAQGRVAVLVVPGFWRTRGYETMRVIGSHVSEKLAHCAVMDCRGHGDSSGVFEFNRREHHDVAAVARSLIEETDAECIVLFGFSAGGALAISAAARHHDLPLAGVVLISPVSDFRRVIPRPNPFTLHRHLSLGAAVRPPRFRWPREDRISPLEDIRDIAAPICLIHPRNDWLVHHSHSEALYRRARAAELHIVDNPGRYHADKMIRVAPERVWPIVERFIERVSTP